MTNRDPNNPQLPEKSKTDSPQDADFNVDFGANGSNGPATPPPGNQHRSTGTSMYWAAAIIVLAMLTMFFNSRLEQNKQTHGVTEKLMRQSDGHYYSRGTIDEQPVVFIVDTGASVLSIPAKLAEQMSLPRLAPETAYTANGEVTVYNTRPVSVRLRDIELHGVEAHINPGMDSNGVLLGMSFLGRLDFRQRDNMLILKSRPE